VWDSEVLARVRHLHLRARSATEAILMGEHRSRRVGQAIEFADYQEYRPGMDLRRLDWRVWGRTDRHVVRRFETETELPCTLVVDLSGDLGTGHGKGRGRPDLDHTKAGTAITLAATLLYFLHRHGEPVGLEIVAGDGIPFRSLVPRSGRNHLQLLFSLLAAVKPGGKADLGRSLGNAGGRTRRRSWVGVITDGMEEPSSWLPALGAFARRGADVRFFHLYDAREWELAFGRPALFFSPEGGDGIAVDPEAPRAAFADVCPDYVDEVRGGVVRWGGRYHLIRTDAPLEAVLRRAILDELSAVVPPVGAAPSLARERR
jgi:uncharacterized protein (DUF58 family)